MLSLELKRDSVGLDCPLIDRNHYVGLGVVHSKAHSYQTRTSDEYESQNHLSVSSLRKYWMKDLKKESKYDLLRPYLCLLLLL